MDRKLEEDLARFLTALEARFGEGLLVLAAFGSQVQGTARPESDLDVLVVARDLPRRRLDRHGLLTSVAREVGQEFAERVSIIPLTPTEARTVKPFYLGLLDGHRLFVDRGAFLQEVLDRLQRRLDELGARRLTDERGNRYWDLKPGYVLGEDVVL